MLTVLVPAHKAGYIEGEAPQIVTTIRSLQAQSYAPDRIVVLVNNCQDETPQLAEQAGAEVVMVPPNPHMKAGALNYWLDANLSGLADDDQVMVMDADSELDSEFLRAAMRYIRTGFHAVGGVFTGKDGGGFVGMLQRNEYARYARDVSRKAGATLVLTGTATLFTAKCLKDVVAGRADGRIPMSGDVAQVYDTKALTEDNELTFAIMHLGYKILAPAECKLKTEVMLTWHDLARQRYRWKRGAIENNAHYGVTRCTAKYWGLQTWGTLGVIVTAIYLASIVFAVVTASLTIYPVWMAVTAVYALERIVTVRRRGIRQMAVAGSILIEMPYDIFLQSVQAKALVSSALRTQKSW